MASWLLFILLLLNSSVAYAKGEPGPEDEDKRVRVRIDTSLASMDRVSVIPSDSEAARFEREGLKSIQLSLGGAESRLHGSYLLSPALEVGLGVALGVTSLTSFTDETEAERGRSTSIGLLLEPAYNLKLREGTHLFVQPEVGLFNRKISPEEEEPSGSKYLLYGALIGLHQRTVKYTTIDLGLEYLGGSGHAYDNGERDDSYTGKLSHFGLRAGLGLRL